MKKYFLYLMLTICLSDVYATSSANQPVRDIIAEFLSNDWPAVLAAKEKLENAGPSVIPDIIALLADCKTNKLQNTGDLIYPGAEKFFGHGQIIDYEIDINCIRAGWLLEDLTFIDFGFTGIHLPVSELVDFIKTDFPDYYSIPENQKLLGGMEETEKRELIRTLSIKRVNAWWLAESKQWNRLSALEKALTSTDENSQVKALFYLRNGKTSCKGLNQKYYKTRLSKTVEKLSKSETNRVSENAKLIMLDSDFSWLGLKPVN
jgi:hypothetical protein